MPIRITGMNSGLDTESIISELVKAKSEKKNSLVKAQTKLQWKQDAWKELNTKVYSFYSKTLSNLRFEGDYYKKTTKVSSSAATVITGANAVNGVQTLEIKELAKSGYLTGGELDSKVTGSTTMKDLGISDTELTMKVGDKSTTIELKENTTVNDVVSQLKSAGVNASYDEKNHRFFISSKDSGLSNEFSLVANDAAGTEAMQKLKIATGLTKTEKEYYAQFCTESNGVYTAKTVTDSDVADLVTARVAAYQTEYDSIQESLEKNAAAKKQLTDKYTGWDSLTSEALITQMEELSTKIETAKANEEALIPEEKTQLEEMESKLADMQSYQKLLTEESELTKRQSEIKADCDITDGTLSAKKNLRDAVRTEEQVKWDTAASVLNNPAVSQGATRIEASDAVIMLNGAEFTSNNNTFEINGLTITANEVTTSAITLTTADDTDGIYDMIKNFFKEYNTLINEMDKLYNADSSKGYEPLTDDEKEAMSESEIEKWEEKIKSSILRKDSTLSSVSGAMKEIMLQGVTIGDKKMYLSDFGINTLGYFSSADNEKNAYHIDGDPDDTNTSSEADKLKTAIANDPDTVIKFFSELSKNLYSKLGDLMKKTDYSSSFTLYDDIAMKNEYNDYTTKISDQEDKITAYEDRYYKKFSAMETALSKLSSKENALSGLFG